MTLSANAIRPSTWGHRAAHRVSAARPGILVHKALTATYRELLDEISAERLRSEWTRGLLPDCGHDYGQADTPPHTALGASEAGTSPAAISESATSRPSWPRCTR